MISIQPIPELTLEMLQPLLDASLAEGYTFIQKLWDEYQSGQTAFRENGSALLAGYADGRLVAVGGVHPDTYLNDPTIGRIRHVYVLPEYRRQGIAKQLVEALIERGAAQFTIITLRTPTAHGHAFYTAIGFSDEPRFDSATHWLAVQSG